MKVLIILMPSIAWTNSVIFSQIFPFIMAFFFHWGVMVLPAMSNHSTKSGFRILISHNSYGKLKNCCFLVWLWVHLGTATSAGVSWGSFSGPQTPLVCWAALYTSSWFRPFSPALAPPFCFGRHLFFCVYFVASKGKRFSFFASEDFCYIQLI